MNRSSKGNCAFDQGPIVTRMQVEATAQVGDIDLCYQRFGREKDPTIVLIMGLGTQMIAWPVAFCEQLAAAGFQVIRFDNRDIGLSSKIPTAKDIPRLSLQQGWLRYMLGRDIPVTYDLNAMAADTIGLMDELGIAQAHVVGASMGGMIAQLVTANYPERALSLTSIMSSSGSRRVPPGKPKVLMRIGTAPASTERDALIAHYMKTMRMIGSPGYLTPEDELKKRVAAGIDRSYHPAGTARQAMAIFASGSRVKALRTIQKPALVIHGDADPLIPLAGGKHTASCIPNAKLAVIEGMGHDFPPQLLGRLAGYILEHIQTAA